MAGTIDVLLRCFAGVELRGDVLWLNPSWPESLGTLEFPIIYRDHVITVNITDHTARVSSRPGDFPPVRVGCHGQLHDLAPGHSLEFSF